MNFVIVKIRQMFQPDMTGRDAPVILDGVYDSLDHAWAEVEALVNEPYYTAYNEAGRPAYYVVGESTVRTIEARRDDAGLYDWTDAACDCTECDACLALMRHQDAALVVSLAL